LITERKVTQSTPPITNYVINLDESKQFAKENEIVQHGEYHQYHPTIKDQNKIQVFDVNLIHISEKKPSNTFEDCPKEKILKCSTSKSINLKNLPTKRTVINVAEVSLKPDEIVSATSYNARKTDQVESMSLESCDQSVGYDSLNKTTPNVNCAWEMNEHVYPSALNK
jgi:hypothetical protein